MSYFQELHDALTAERDYDRVLYRDQISGQGPKARANLGTTWYPIIIKDIETTAADYAYVQIENPNPLSEASIFRVGMPVELFSQTDPKAYRVTGTISHLFRNKMTVFINQDELPEWSRNGKLGVDALFDEYTYDEMFSALKTAQDADHFMTKLLIGQEQATFHEIKTTPLSGLNQFQNEAVHKILSAKNLAIVHGPPGTGKTTTLVAAIKNYLSLNKNKKILVTAASNIAVDVLAERLHYEKVKVIRIGNPVRVSDSLNELTMDYKIEMSGDQKRIKELKKQAAALRDMATKYKRSFGKDEREQRKLLLKEVSTIRDEIKKTEDYTINKAIDDADVIATTLIGAQNYLIKNLKYDLVVIDECGQALEPACWIPILKTDKVVLAGDHLQLPPTIKGMGSPVESLALTLLEKLVAKQPQAVVLLREQYRMNEMIMQPSNQYFYKGGLIAAPIVAHRKAIEELSPLLFIDTAGCGFEEVVEDTAISNPDEATLLVKHLKSLINEHKDLEIGILSPYKEQTKVLKELLNNTPNIQVNTIDGFQGQEKDIIYISLVRSNSDHVIGFLSELRRMNVAITRARKHVILVGDSATLSSYPFYDHLIQYAQEIGGYTSAWEFLYD